MPVHPTNNAHPDTGIVHDEVREILGAPPRWIAKWGNLLVLGTVLVLLSVAIFIQYPDITYGKVSLVPSKKALPVFVPAGYIVKRIMVGDNEAVRKGQPLFYLAKAAGGPAGAGADCVAAAEDGKVVFQRDARAATDTSQAILLMVLVPREGHYNATVTISAYGSGRVGIGQQVIIKLDSYPGREFGSITGTVVSKPFSINEHSVVVSVELDKGVTTTYNKRLEIYDRAEGTAEIITSHKRLIRQVFNFF